MSPSNKARLSYLALLALLSAPTLAVARGNEPPVERFQNRADEAKTDLRKGSRKVKRRVRNATGNASVTEDIKDAAHNAGDEIKTAGRKIKRKAE